jgi:hypothetical protein
MATPLLGLEDVTVKVSNVEPAEYVNPTGAYELPAEP